MNVIKRYRKASIGKKKKLSQKANFAGKAVSRKDKCHCISMLDVFPPSRLFVQKLLLRHPLIILHRTWVHFTFHQMHQVSYHRFYNSSFARHVSLILDLILIGVSSPFFRSLKYSYRVSPNRSCLYSLPGYLQFLIPILKVSSIRNHRGDKNKRGNNMVNSSQHLFRQLHVYADDSTFRLPGNVPLLLLAPMLLPRLSSIILSQITFS